jgi:nitroreductase
MIESRNAGRELSDWDFPAAAAIETQLRFLLRYAVLAPSPRNSQPWSFAVRENQVFLLADLARSQPVSDPDRRELYLALGCALENLLIAAEHFGFTHQVSYFPRRWHPEIAAAVRFHPGGTLSAARAGTTLNAIRQRRNDISLFHPVEVPPEFRRRLSACCNEPDLLVNVTDDARFHRWIVALTRQSDEIDLANQAFRMEADHWDVQGGLGPTVGLLEGKDRHPRVNRRAAVSLINQLKVESSGLLGVIGGAGDSHLIHLRAGQLFERIWLTATVLGVSINPMSQTMRRPELRLAVARLSPSVGWLPQHLFRIGYSSADSGRRTRRRPVDEVLL